VLHPVGSARRWIPLVVDGGADVLAVALSPSGRFAALSTSLPAPSETTSGDGVLAVYDTGTGVLLHRTQFPNAYRHVALPTDTTVRVQYRADGGDTVTAELGLSDLRPTGQTGRRPFSPRTLVKYSTDGAFEVVNGFGRFGVRATIGAAESVGTRASPPSHQAGMFTVSDDGQRVATGHDGTIHVLATTAAASQIPDSMVLTGLPSVDALRFVTPDRMLSTSGSAVAIWDLAQVSRITTPTVGYLVDRARYEQDPTVLPTPDGRLAVIADEVGHHAYVIDLDSGQQLYESPPFREGRHRRDSTVDRCRCAPRVDRGPRTPSRGGSRPADAAPCLPGSLRRTRARQSRSPVAAPMNSSRRTPTGRCGSTPTTAVAA
jgi:hypothetical protein